MKQLEVFKTVKKDIWNLPAKYTIVIPINLQGVMGRGLAKQANDKFPELQSWLQGIILEGWKWNRRLITYFVEYKYKNFSRTYNLILFPVKTSWRLNADIDLIAQSCKALVKTVKDPIQAINKIAMPQVGCGFGDLNWRDVKYTVLPELEAIRDKVLLVQPTKHLVKKYPVAFKPGVKRDKLCLK